MTLDAPEAMVMAMREVGVEAVEAVGPTEGARLVTEGELEMEKVEEGDREGWEEAVVVVASEAVKVVGEEMGKMRQPETHQAR